MQSKPSKRTALNRDRTASDTEIVRRWRTGCNGQSAEGGTSQAASRRERRTRLAEVALQLRREELPLTPDRIDHQLNYRALQGLRHPAR